MANPLKSYISLVSTIDFVANVFGGRSDYFVETKKMVAATALIAKTDYDKEVYNKALVDHLACDIDYIEAVAALAGATTDEERRVLQTKVKNLRRQTEHFVDIVYRNHLSAIAKRKILDDEGIFM